MTNISLVKFQRISRRQFGCGDHMVLFQSDMVENIVGKGENAGLKMYPKASFSRSLLFLFGEGLRHGILWYMYIILCSKNIIAWIFHLVERIVPCKSLWTQFLPWMADTASSVPLRTHNENVLRSE